MNIRKVFAVVVIISLCGCDKTNSNNNYINIEDNTISVTSTIEELHEEEKNIEEDMMNVESSSNINKESLIIDAKNQVISRNEKDINDDGKTEEIRIIVDDGYFNEDNELWAGNGPKWEGQFSIQVLDCDGKEIYRVALNNLINGTGASIFFYAPEFQLEFLDYNNDGLADFTLTQYSTSNQSAYYMFTINGDGKIDKLEIQDYEAFYGISTRVNSKILTVEENEIITYSFNSMDGKYYYNYYTWNYNEKVFVHENRIEEKIGD